MSGATTTGRFAAIAQLVLARVREFYREPEAVFWTYGFPLLMATALGIAFRERPVETMAVDFVQSSAAETVAKQLSEHKHLEVTVLDEESCRRRLRSGKTSVVVRVQAGSADSPASDVPAPDWRYEYWYDFNRPESQLARNSVDDAIQRGSGRVDMVKTNDEKFEEPGGRYIDFLVPGLLGMSLMGGGLWGIGFVIVDMRMRKLLKRLLATPMRKSEFLAAVMISRLLFLIPEVLILLVFARVAFGVKCHGNPLAALAIILLGAGTFTGLGLLLASRAKTIEAVSGLMNLVMLPMWVFSGIFFSSERFPEALQPFVKALPLTMVIDSLRAVMLDGLPLATQSLNLFALVAWGGIPFVVALRWFRWQ